MKRASEGFARPYGSRDFELVRAGRDGSYWQAADGMMVHLAAPEHRRARLREAESSDTPLVEGERAPGHSAA